MRPFEMLLSLANLLTFIVSMVPRLWAAVLARFMAIIALLAVGVQALNEGPRWQMIPAYALSVMLFLVSFLRGSKVAREVNRQRRIKLLLTLVAAGLSVLGLIGSGLLTIILPVFRFSRPTGPYAVGTLTY